MLIGPGDLLGITVLGFDRGAPDASGTGASSVNALPSTFLVDSDGKILFPFVGTVDLAGLSQIGASRLLMEKLRPYLRYPQVTVLIQSSNSYNVSVLGDVLHPGQFPIRGKPDVLSMIAQAGGPAPDPDLGGVLVTRGDQKIQIDLGKYLTDKNCHQPSPTVYPGDVIYVPNNPWPTLKDVGLFLSIVVSGVVVASVIANSNK